MPSAVSWLKAMVEPKLMEIRRMETMEVVRMALRGMSWTTWYWSQYWWFNREVSIAMVFIVFYVCLPYCAY